MLTREDIEQILDEYVQWFIPAMQRWRYHLILAKGGQEYPHLSEQSMFGHIINGVFGLVRLLKFVLDQGIFVYGLDEGTVRKALSLYSVHDVHKLGGFERMGPSEFSIPLERLREEYQRLGLDKFADIDAHLMRASNVSKRSSHQGDILLGDEEGTLLWLLVRIADTLSSVEGPGEARSSLEGYLKSLGPEFAPRNGRYALYYHEIRDVRGVLTNQVHSVIAQRLQNDWGSFPLLFFATGTLYLGPRRLSDLDRRKFILEIVEETLVAMARQGRDTSAAMDGLRRQKYDFEKYVFTFSDVRSLLDLVHQETLRAKPDARIAEKEIGSISRLKDTPVGWADMVEERLGIFLSEPRAFNERWSLVRRYLLYVDTLLRDLAAEEDRLEWFLNTFVVPKNVADNLRQERQLWVKGGLGKYVLVIAYHFLKGPDFSERASVARPEEQILDILHRRVLEAMAKLDTDAGRRAAVAELGFRGELTDYLLEHLFLSFSPEVKLEEDALLSYGRPKGESHSSKLCSICNRRSEYVQDLRTGVLGDFGRVFSNRVLPAEKAPQKNRPWCPICHLEFILRKLVGLSLPIKADYGNSYRIYIYVLPTFSFTPERTQLFEPLLHPFQQVSSLQIRDYGRDAPGVPRMWLEQREMDPQWIEDVVEVFSRQAEWISQRGGRDYVGERITTSRAGPQPNYYLIAWEKSAAGTERDDARIPTRTEAWAKASFAAMMISGLTSCKVYVTERPYLPVVDPAGTKATITLDSPPPVLRGIVGEQTTEISLYGRERGGISGLERALDIAAALWVITADVHGPNRRTKDKQIAERLGLITIEPLAGAHFYKEYGRLNEDRSPFPTLTKACEVLLEHLGGEMMDLVEQIAEKSLAIRLPFRTSRRGKAHSYELVFREGVEAMRKAFTTIPSLRATSVIGEKPSEESLSQLKKQAAGTVLKAMERRQVGGRGEGIVNPSRGDLGRLIGEFIDLLVDELFLHRANGSFARFLRLENAIADGVYYHTDRVISDKWDEYNKARTAREAKAS